VPVPPLVEVPEGEAPEFDCHRGETREAAETKAGALRPDSAGGECCAPGECC
jgi:hypothetical protein